MTYFIKGCTKTCNFRAKAPDSERRFSSQGAAGLSVGDLSARDHDKGDMYMVIIKEQLLAMDNGKAVCRAELAVDTAAELPSPAQTTDRVFAAGSLAWVISTGGIYGLDSQGSWILQNS